MIRGVATLLLFAGALLGAEDEKPIWLVVGRPALVPALDPLVAHRRAQGYETIVTTEPVAKALAKASRAPAFLLLVGDDEPGKADAPWHLPSPRRPLYRWRSVQRKDFASDALLADRDGDLVPDFPVGRIPARTAEEVAAFVAKVIAYEALEPRDEDLRLVVWGGAPGYGDAIDSMATGLLTNTVKKHAPPLLARYLISADPGRALCGWPPDHPSVFAREMRRGSVLNAVLAHASARRISSVEHEGKWVHFGIEEARAGLGDGPPVSPLVLLSCSCGEFAGGESCLAEDLLRLGGGPVAVIAATTESHPLTNYFTGVSLLQALAEVRGTIGEVWHEGQSRALTARSLLVGRMLKGAEGSLEPEIDVPKLRRDQALMYALLGDPATRLRMPLPLPVTIEKQEKGWSFRVERPEGATRLSVSHRVAKAPRAKRTAGRDAEEERARFVAANAAGAFAPLVDLGAGAPWEGRVEAPGWVRFVVTGPGIFRAAVAELR